jgi:histidyl-tRNA synthetase
MGGKNTPASGFALQMNTLMNALEMPAPAGTEVNRILIIANDSQPEIIKSAYNAAGSLRKAGCIVSVQVDSEDKADFKWLIEVSGKSPDFVVINRANKHKQNAQTIGEVLKLLGENSGS